LSLRARIILLAVIALLPAVVLLMLNEVSIRRHLERGAHRAMLAQARLIDHEQGRLQEGGRTLLVSMGLHFAAGPPDAAACRRYMDPLNARFPLYVALFVTDAAGTIVCSAPLMPPGTTVRDRAYFSRALAAQDLVVGAYIRDEATGKPVIHYAMPYWGPAGETLGVVAASVDLGAIARSLAYMWPNQRTLITIADRDGIIVVTLPDHDSRVGEKAPPVLLDRLASAAEETFEGPDLEGRMRIWGLVPAAARPRGLLVAVGTDKASALEEVAEATNRGILIIAVGLAGALLAAWWAGYTFIRRPLDEIMSVMSRWRAGDHDARVLAGVRGAEFGRLAASVNQMADTIENLLREKDLLMRELQHRIANSLQLLSSILSMQSRLVQNADTRAHLQAARQRIASIGAVYRHLYGAGSAALVEFGAFLRTFCQESARAYLTRPGARIDVDTEKAMLPMNKATALALALHELLMNAEKHAYPGQEGGPVRVTLRNRTDGGIELRVSDEGVGLPSGFDAGSTASLGMGIVHRLVQQLNGRVDIERRDKGTTFALVFPPSIKQPGTP